MKIETVNFNMSEKEQTDRIVQLELENIANKLSFQAVFAVLLSKGLVTQEEITQTRTQIFEGMKPKLVELGFDTDQFEKFIKSNSGI